MIDEAAACHVHSLGFVPDCYKSQKVCDKVVSTYPSTIQFVPDRFKTYEICA